VLVLVTQKSRGGQIDASVVTGRGVQALQAGFDTQIKAAQAQFAIFFTELISLAFKVDEKIFGSTKKEIVVSMMVCHTQCHTFHQRISMEITL
jgi:hypothetical protein